MESNRLAPIKKVIEAIQQNKEVPLKQLLIVKRQLKKLLGIFIRRKEGDNQRPGP